MTCSNCHKHIPSTVNYCSYCGTRTDNAVIPAYFTYVRPPLPLAVKLLPFLIGGVGVVTFLAVYSVLH